MDTGFDEGLSYILPIKTATAPSAELVDYLRMLAADATVELIVVDGSTDEIFNLHSGVLPPSAHHVRPDPNLGTPMGKVGGVLTGIRLASHERMIIADDDVRYDAKSLAQLCTALDDAEVVRPQNYFLPLPFHAAWDTGRALLNRVSGGDWPGTLGVRRSAMRVTNGYDGNAMFENLELVRTVVAAGGRESVRPDIYVLRRPSTTRHFWSQRVRQAYDELARPARLVAQLAILPSVTLLAISGNWPALVIVMLVIIAMAELGRQRFGGVRFFPFTASMLAPGWVAERAICSWLAIGSRIFLGGVNYRGRVVAHAATPMRVLRRRYSAEWSSRSIGLNVPLLESSAEHAVTPTIRSISARSNR